MAGSDAPLYLQLNFAKRLSSFLPKFEQKGPSTFHCRCIACGDSQSSTTKKRGWIFEKSGNLFYYCHNCGLSLPLGGFLKKFVPSLYNEYNMERFRNSENEYKPQAVITKPKVELKSRWEQFITWDLPPHALKFLKDRKLPDVTRFGYTADASKLAMDLHEFYGIEYTKSVPKLEGIVIPFISFDGTCSFIQIRTFSKDKNWRYLTIGFGDADIKLFGLDKVDVSKPIYVTEGPFDSCFITNSVATADSSLERANLKLFDASLVLVYDNEPRSNQIVSKLSNVINNGYTVVLFPDYIQEKDLNDMYLAGHDVQRLVEQYQYQGLAAKMQLAVWRKC